MPFKATAELLDVMNLGGTFFSFFFLLLNFGTLQSLTFVISYLQVPSVKVTSFQKLQYISCLTYCFSFDMHICFALPAYLPQLLQSSILLAHFNCTVCSLKCYHTHSIQFETALFSHLSNCMTDSTTTCSREVSQ